MLENFLHYFLNGDAFLSATESDVGSIKQKAQEKTLSTAAGIKGIWNAYQSNGYFWKINLVANLWWNRKAIYAMEQQLGNLPKEVFEQHQKRLPEIKLNLWSAFILAVDKIELAFALNPEYCSGPMMQKIDEHFETYLAGMNLGVVAFTTLRNNTAIEEKRRAYYEAELVQSRQNISDFEAKKQKIQDFLASFKKCPLRFLESQFKDEVYPIVKDFHAQLKDETSYKELRNAQAVAQDEQFKSWRGDDEEIPCYSELIQYTEYALEGLIKTEELRIQLLTSKQEIINKKIQDKQDASLSCLQQYYDNFVQSTIELHLTHMPKIGQLYQPQLKHHLETFKLADLNEVTPLFLDECTRKIESTLEQEDPVVELLNKKMQAHLKAFEKTQNEYLALESILSLIEKFESYLDKRGDDDTFENEATKTQKRGPLKQIKAIALSEDAALSSSQRLNNIQGIMDAQAAGSESVKFVIVCKL